MIERLHSLVVLFCLSALVSCNTEQRRINNALHGAGTNRPELEAVLDFYREGGDEEKYRAARFIIANMPGHYSYRDEETADRDAEVDSLLSANPVKCIYPDAKRISRQMDTLYSSFPSTNIRAVADMSVISSDFLIDRIDEAFKLWRDGTWATHLNFEEFCDYVLPYSPDDYYVLEDWRSQVAAQIDSTVIERLADFRYSSEMSHSAFWACRELNQSLMLRFDGDNATADDQKIYHIPTKTRVPYGTCKHFCDINMMFMRSLGIPVAIDFTPQWPFRSMGHTWNVVLMNNGMTKPYGGCSDDLNQMHKPDQKMAKVYRRTYSINEEILKLKSAEMVVPSTFSNPFIKDVTCDYMKTSNVSTRVKGRCRNRYAYLAVFDNQNWIPICYGKRKMRQFVFENVGRDIVYLPVFCSDNGLTPFSDPFILNYDGTVHLLHAELGQRQTIMVTRKFPVLQRVQMFVGRMIGGRIEAADRADFADANLIHEITSWSILTDSVVVKDRSPHRYWRYLSPEGSCGNIAELEFYDTDGNIVRGAIIGTDGTFRQGDTATSKRAVFDGKVLTYFNAPKDSTGVYVGMDFGKSISLGTIKYIPRNDDNNICCGDDYELYYWSDSGWTIVDRKTATGGSLVFDDVPDNALLLLKDVTKGKEERIFTYQDGQQTWW